MRSEQPRQGTIDISDIGHEPIRLVIWDLDDTYWNGTITEGGIEYNPTHHNIVIELARRGIISSICSRNDYETIKALMTEHNIWDYFVFPSIDWTAKGPRLKQILEASQLRPATILFIDDNPMNRAEAASYVPGIRVADPSFISVILHDQRFKGKDDTQLTRLSQYRLLEKRFSDMKIADDSSAFLLDSDIRVSIDYDVAANLDRAIELINRTNQLNFTKLRLPEDMGLARNELCHLLNKMETQAGLIRVTDRYGDYGYCGLYIQHHVLHGGDPRLLHFCFSCRTLGMEVETWLYQKLGSPQLQINGDVLTDVKSGRSIDWIRLEAAVASKYHDGGTKPSRKVPRIFMRGGCETVAISSYFQLLTDELITEFSFQRDGFDVRFDHSIMLRQSLEKPSAEAMASLTALGYQHSDFQTTLLPHSDSDCSVYILGMWAEAGDTVFRHKSLGFPALVYLNFRVGIQARDLLLLPPDYMPEPLTNGPASVAMQELRSNYEYVGIIPQAITKENIVALMAALPKTSLVFLLGCTESMMDANGNLSPLQNHIDLNNVFRACAAEIEQVEFVDLDSFIHSNRDRHGPFHHYSRDVYFRMASAISQKIEAWTADNDEALQ